MTNAITQAALRTFGRHFVTLSCMQTPAGTEAEHPVLFSGFVIDVEGYWFYVTAGHVIRRIDQALTTGSKFDVWRLGDQAAQGPHQTGIPFDFMRDDWIVIRDDVSGLDYAALALRDLYRNALETGQVFPIPKDAWDDHTVEYDQWMLVGVPSETVIHNGQSLLTAKVVGVGLVEVDAPETAGHKSDNQFYAKLHDSSESVVRNVEGMSGGPIFAIKRQEGELRYKVIGVQSTWYPSSRIVAACPFTSLAYGLEKAVHLLTSRAIPGAT